MADIKSIQVDGIDYAIKDESARSNIGDLSQLATEAKGDLVSALNELSANAGSGSSPIQRVESLDESNLKNLRDLTTGSYVLYGYFRPYAGASSYLPFDNLLVNVYHVDEGSHLFEFSTANSEVNFIEILVDSTADSGFTYSRTAISMLELNGLIGKLGNLNELATTEKGSVVAAINEVAASGGSGGEYTLPIGGDELGGVKNGGNVTINEDGTMTAPESSGSSVQADLAQNDPAQPDYVKNRTHWVEGSGATIEWDGNTEGRDSFDSDGMLHYKVSDLTPSKSELVGAIVGKYDGDVYSEVEMTEEALSLADLANCVNCLLFDCGFIIYDTDCSIAGNPLTVPSTGTYLAIVGDTRISKLTYGSTTYHPLDEAFIPDTIARTADIPTDDHINELINTALGVIENGTY